MADDGLRRGARAYVVLDCIPVERDGIPYRRVIVRGVYGDEPDAPPPYEGAARNAVGVFIGLDMQTPAFLVEYPRELDESQRFQVSEARDVLGTWDLANPGGISRETVLADQVRALLAIVDQAFPPETEDRRG